MEKLQGAHDSVMQPKDLPTGAYRDTVEPEPPPISIHSHSTQPHPRPGSQCWSFWFRGLREQPGFLFMERPLFSAVCLSIP